MNSDPEDSKQATCTTPLEEITVTQYYVWDRSVRWFHWINVICVLGLMGIGIVILNASSLGVDVNGKISLKIFHAWIGYVFALNLIYRLCWGFIGSHYSRWKNILPFVPDYLPSLKDYLRHSRSGKPSSYRGHNPLGKLMVTAMFLLLSTQLVTGLVIAGTDLYFPPFGHEFAEWATGAGEDHTKLVGLEPGAKEMLDPEGYAEMRKFREPFIAIHKFVFFALLVSIFIHIGAVVLNEVRERSGIVSAMFSGTKSLQNEPKD